MLRSFVVGLLGLGLCFAATAQETADVEKAKTNLQRAAEAAAAAAAKAQQAIAQAVAIRSPSRGGQERETVDPQDPIERFALLTAAGPVVVQVTLTIDGQPFRIGREKLVADMIAAADTDKDGQTTWTEALSTARFTLGRLGNLPDQVRESMIRSFDKNANKLVESDEARQFLAQYQGATLSLGDGSGSYRLLVGGMLLPAPLGQPDLLKLLDTDSSKSLDGQELAAATARLKSRDADDNDVLDAAEISGAPTGNLVRVGTFGGPTQTPSGVLLLGPTSTPATILAALRQKYASGRGKVTADCFPQVPQLFAALDKDGNGELDAGEASKMNDVGPHVELTVDLATQKAGAGLRMSSLTSEISSADDGRNKKTLELSGVRISLAANAAAPPAQNYDSIAKSFLMRYDSNGNGYLEKSELPGNQFDLYDDNGDGKAYPDEIAAGYARQYAPQLTQVVVNVVQQGNSLFQTLDANGDGKLGLREMRAAAERLAALDKDDDQIIGGNEIPEAVSVSFALGSVPGNIVERPVGVPTLAGRAVNTGPEWFTRMDRNGDGDVTLKEFLGSEDDFKRLDTSGDGLLDPQEARAAGK
jgi:EF hand